MECDGKRDNMYIYIFWGLSLDFAVPHVHIHILGSVLGLCCPMQKGSPQNIYIFWGLSLDFAVPHVHLHILGSVLGFCCPLCTFTYSGVCPWILLSLMYIYIFWGLDLDFAVPCKKGRKKGRLRTNHTLKTLFYHITKTTVISHTHTLTCLNPRQRCWRCKLEGWGISCKRVGQHYGFTTALESDCSSFH